MNDPGRTRWPSAAILAGVCYFAVNVAATELAGRAASQPMVLFWRWTAFIISAVVFAAHIAHEHFRLGNAARPAAWHAAVAVALGALLLALVANIHDLGSGSGYRPRMAVALVAWPLVTAVPAFVVALVTAAGLGAMRRRG